MIGKFPTILYFNQSCREMNMGPTHTKNKQNKTKCKTTHIHIVRIPDDHHWIYIYIIIGFTLVQSHKLQHSFNACKI